jgi:electron transport complex protein RnfC
MITQIRFYGGIHPSEGKVSNKEDIINAPLQELYTVSLQQHIGAPAKMVVQKGDHVLRGQLLGEPGGFVSAAVHSPTSGTVKDVTTCLGPAGATLPAVVIESDGEDKAADPLPPFENWQDADPAALKARVGEAGIVGMGGATFPTFVKLSPPPNVKIDTIILDGVECEPCLTADHRLMLETPEKIVKGAQIIGRILGVKRIIIAIELNKPDAIETMTKAAEGTGVEVAPLVVRYPQGAEKQLIYALTGRKVPSGGLPAAVGCVVSNVGTTAAIYEAVCLGKPLYERVTTVTGTPVVKPGNYRFRVGTLYRTALELCGGVSEDPAKIISGGPMMGMAVYSLDIPVMKGTSGILLLSRDELVQYSPSACLRCGRCNDVCPMSMMPGILSAQIEHQKFELAEKWHVMDCIECGSCAYICPAGRPLVQHMRRAKAVVNAKKRAAAAAAAAAAKK